MTTYILWGAVAALSLLVGAGLGVARSWSDRLVGSVLAFGAGALISSVSFELVEEGLHSSAPGWIAGGIAAGALTYYLADRAVESMGAADAPGRMRRHSKGGVSTGRLSEAGREGQSGNPTAAAGAGGGLALALGALLDGIPEQAVLGLGLAGGKGVSMGLLVAVFVSNLPESLGSSADMRAGGTRRARILGLWAAVAVVCTLATLAGGLLGSAAPAGLTGVVQGFAAGALLVMLVDQMIPEAHHKAGRPAGLLTVVGFAVAAALSLLA